MMQYSMNSDRWSADGDTVSSTRLYDASRPLVQHLQHTCVHGPFNEIMEDKNHDLKNDVNRPYCETSKRSTPLLGVCRLPLAVLASPGELVEIKTQ